MSIGEQLVENLHHLPPEKQQVLLAFAESLAVPCTTYRPDKRIYSTHVLIQAPDGGLGRDSIALGEQVRVIGETAIASVARGVVSIDACPT